MGYHRVHAVVEAFDVNAEDTIEIFRRCALDGADVRDAGIVDENVQAVAVEDLLEDRFYCGVIANVAAVWGSVAVLGRDLVAGFGCGFFVEIEDVNGRAVGGKFECDGAADAAARAGDEGSLAIESKLAGVGERSGQRDTPRFQGMKSSCAFCSALVRTAPLAT